MKIKGLLTLALACFVTFQISGQEETTDFSKFNIRLTTGIGYGKVENDDQPNYDLNANIGEVLFTYNISKSIGLSTGLGWLQLSGNGFNLLGNFYHERDLIKIPLLLKADKDLGGKFNFYALVGFYGQTVINDKYRYLTFTERDVFGGWTFGFQGNFALEYELDNDWAVGINIATQSDFSKLKTENDSPFKDEQLITTLNTIGLSFNYKF